MRALMPQATRLAQLTPTPFFSENALMSFYGRGNFNISNKYLVTATLRSDGSSRFSKDARWGLFPSAALAWNVLEEDLFAGQTLFSNLKVRMGYGLTGQQDIYNDYGYIPNYKLRNGHGPVSIWQQLGGHPSPRRLRLQPAVGKRRPRPTSPWTTGC